MYSKSINIQIGKKIYISILNETILYVNTYFILKIIWSNVIKRKDFCALIFCSNPIKNHVSIRNMFFSIPVGRVWIETVQFISYLKERALIGLLNVIGKQTKWLQSFKEMNTNSYRLFYFKDKIVFIWLLGIKFMILRTKRLQN